MKKITLSLALLCSALVFSCNNAEETTTTDDMAMEEPTEMMGESVEVKLMAKSDSKLDGMAKFTANGDEVMMDLNVSGLEPGTHAIHIHDVADCSSADGKSAGGHWNPGGMDHGKWGDMAHHAGDIGNFEVDANGNGMMTFSTDKWCIGCEDSTKNILNHGLIIHAGVDDFKTQPTGDAGGRIGCGEIRK